MFKWSFNGIRRFTLSYKYRYLISWRFRNCRGENEVAVNNIGGVLMGSKAVELVDCVQAIEDLEEFLNLGASTSRTAGGEICLSPNFLNYFGNGVFKG